MTVTINGITYEILSWDGNGFSMESEMTLAEAETDFAPGSNKTIIVYDGDQEIGRYYNKRIESLTVEGTSPRIIAVKFNLTQIADDVEAEIRGNIEDSDGAIMELAELISDMSDTMGTIDQVEEKMNRINEDHQEIWRSIRSIIDRLDALEPHNIENEGADNNG